MRHVVITKPGGPDVMQIQEVDDPILGPNEVLIAVKASGINFADILARQGLYPDAPKMPCVVGYEVAGDILEVGEGVELPVNTPVFAMTRFHGYADKVKVHVSQIYKKPEKLSYEQAAAIPVNYLTAYQLLVVMGSLHAGETVLIHNAGGGVGLAAIEIAKHIGAKIIGTASKSKHDFLKSRGVDHVIDYRHGDWAKEIKEITKGKGVELITDPLGGSHWKKSYKALRATGRLGMFGISTATESSFGGKLSLLKTAAGMPFFHPARLMNGNKSAFGVNLGHMWHEVGMIKNWVEILLGGIEEGWIEPHVDKTFDLTDAGSAHAYIEARKNIGKVVLTV